MKSWSGCRRQGFDRRTRMSGKPADRLNSQEALQNCRFEGEDRHRLKNSAVVGAPHLSPDQVKAQIAQRASRIKREALGFKVRKGAQGCCAPEGRRRKGWKGNFQEWKDCLDRDVGSETTPVETSVTRCPHKQCS